MPLHVADEPVTIANLLRQLLLRLKWLSRVILVHVKPVSLFFIYYA